MVTLPKVTRVIKAVHSLPSRQKQNPKWMRPPCLKQQPHRHIRRVTYCAQAACWTGSEAMTSSSTALECGCCFSQLAAASELAARCRSSVSALY